MVKIRRCPKLFAFVIGVVCMASTVIAEVVVNEAMINEPGGATNREWFELYVDSDQAVLMDGYRVLVGDATITFAPGYFLGPHEFLVICRKLVSTDGASFEGHWGDSSGVWGDTPDETAILTPIEATFSLVNKGGSIQLFHDGHLVSDVTWTGPGVDGVSLERVSPQSNTVKPSVDWEGSTPGVVNSVTPVGSDLALEDVSATINDGRTIISFTLVNRGLEMFDETVLSLYYAADSYGTPGALMDQFEIPSLSPGESFETNGEYVFDNMYVDLVAVLPADDRLRNNTRIFTAPATEFPPFQLSELMPKPAAGAFGEWVEIINCLDYPYDLTGWCIGDYKEIELITGTGMMIAPGQRVVLARSASTFAERYPAFDGLLIEPTSWSPLNDDFDTVRLVDGFSLEADRFAYDAVFDDDHTWCRGEEYARRNDWGRSDESGGSPGQANSVVFGDDARRLVLTVTPEVFSPDGDGHEDSVLITLDGPDTDQFELKIYDRQGRVVRHFDQGSYRRETYVWDGCSDGGNRLPIGIYILYCEIEGAGAVKKPIVIAR